MTEPKPRLGEILTAVAVALFCTLIGWSLYRQGIDVDYEGLWLLGTSRLLDGARLYRDFDPGDGPIRYWLLAPWLWLNSKAAALALLRTASLVAAATTGVWWMGRSGVGRLRFVWPIVLVALGPVDPSIAFALCAILLVRSRWSGSAPAIGALLVFAFALDPRVAIGLLVFATGAHFARSFEERAGPIPLLAGAGAAGLVLFLMIPSSGELAPFVQNSLVHPWTRLFDHFADGGALRWWTTLRSGQWVHLPFADLGTGETLDMVWPRQAFLHRWSLRLLAVAIVVVGGAVTWSLRHDRRLGSLAAAAGLVAVWTVASRGDVPALREAGLLTFAMVLVIIADGETSLKMRWTIAGLTLVILPLAAEQLWLSTRMQRPELQTYERGAIFLSQEREQRLEEFFGRLGPALERPMVIWPDQAGLYFLYDVEPAVPQTRLRGLRLEADTRSNDLIAANPHVILLAQSWNSTAQMFQHEDPVLWSTMRERYRVAGWLRGRTDRLRLLVRMQSDETLATLPLARRLPLLELTISNDVSPALRRNLTVGQSFWTGDQDLSGVLFKWQTHGKDLSFDVRVRVWERLGVEFDALLSATTVTVEVPHDGARTYFRLDVPETTHKELAVTLELRDTMTEEVRLYWHRHDKTSDKVDLFESGGALLDLHETDADLYFFAY